MINGNCWRCGGGGGGGRGSQKRVAKEGSKRGSQKVAGLWESDKHMARSAKESIDVVPVIL